MASAQPIARAEPAQEGQGAQLRVYGFLPGTALSDVKITVENALLCLPLAHRSYQITPSLAADSMPIATVVFERLETASLAHHMLHGMQDARVQLQTDWESTTPGLAYLRVYQDKQWLATSPGMTSPGLIISELDSIPDRTPVPSRSFLWRRNEPDTIYLYGGNPAVKAYKCSGPIARMLQEQFASKDEAEVFCQETIFHVSADRLLPVPLDCLPDPDELLNAVRRRVQDMTPAQLDTWNLVAVNLEFVTGSQTQPNCVMVQVSVLTDKYIAASRLEFRLSNFWNTRLIDFPQELRPLVENWARDYMQANYCFIVPVTDPKSGVQQLLVCCCHQETSEEACSTFCSEVLSRDSASAQDVVSQAAREPHAAQSAIQTAVESSTSHAAQAALPMPAESDSPNAAGSNTNSS